MDEFEVEDKEKWGDKLLRLAMRITESGMPGGTVVRVDSFTDDDDLLIDLYNRFADILEASGQEDAE